jgi:hypothetical protein
MAKAIFDSAIAGLDQASGRFERSAAQVTRLAGALSAAESADTVKISPEAHAPTKAQDNDSNARLEGAIVDMRIAKYQFIANLRAIQTGDDIAKTLQKLASK